MLCYEEQVVRDARPAFTVKAKRQHELAAHIVKCMAHLLDNERLALNRAVRLIG
jgi:hypothetical protein